MRQTEQTAIVLRYANYRESDRMLTLFSPTRGRIECLCRGCRKTRSALRPAAEPFALGDYEIYDKGGHATVVAASLIETFYPLREDYERLTCGTYLLGLCEAVVQAGEPDGELFMLLLHTLSRLTFSDQELKPLTAGFLLHFAADQGFRPALDECAVCRKPLQDGQVTFFSEEEGGLVCADCRREGMTPVAPEQSRWMRMAISSGSASWVNTEEQYVPSALLRSFVERRLELSAHRIAGRKLMPE